MGVRRPTRYELPAECMFGNEGRSSMPPADVIKEFYGSCFGVRLTKRGAEDRHLLIGFMCEDDGHWFPMEGSMSTVWLDEVRGILDEVDVWLTNNAEPDWHEEHKRCYGWRLKPSGR